MRLNIEKVKEFIANNYRNNQSFFADEIGVDRHYLNMLLNGKGNETSPKVCNAIIKFCEKKGYNYKDYIFLE